MTAPLTCQNPDSKDELVTTTVRDYDLAETSKAIKGLFTGIAFMGFLHLYMGYVPPVSVLVAEARCPGHASGRRCG